MSTELRSARTAGASEVLTGAVKLVAFDADEVVQVPGASLVEAIGTGSGSGITRPTWSALSAITGVAGDNAIVLDTDTGTHTDPVVGGTVPNSGIYLYVTGSPAGWQRIGATQASIINDAANRAEDAVDAATAAAAASVPFVSRQAVGADPIVTGGTSFENTTTYYLADTLKDYDQYVEEVELVSSSTGAVRLVVSRLMGGSTMDRVSVSEPITISATGALTINGQNIKVPTGCVLGLQRAIGGGYFTSGETGISQFSHSGLPETGTGYSASTANTVRWRPTLIAETAGKARSADTAVTALTNIVGETLTQGWPEPGVATGTDIPANYTNIWQEPSPVDGLLHSVRLGADNTADAIVHVVEIDTGTLELTIIDSCPIEVQSGVHDYVVNLEIEIGQYWGVEAVDEGAVKFQINTNPLGLRVWYYASGALESGVTVVDSNAHRFEMSAKTINGLLAATATPVRDTGLELLSAADDTGLADATSAFANAAAAHPDPYVRPGVFAVTSIPANGTGFWGPGKIYVNDQRFFIHRKPTGKSLFEAFRQRLAEHIAAGNVLTLTADSIGQFAFSETGPQHHFNLLTRFANMGIALDEPGFTALRPSSTYTPAFYGVTTSGTVSTGSAGPLTESLILADGAALSFVGALEAIGLFYTQQSGAGTLTFAYNGTPFHTQSAAGATVLDQYTADPAPNTASGTYTITASGGPVEITGLIRLAPKVAGSPPRLYTNRCAHGGYTFASFDAAARASIMKQGEWAGGKAVPIIALGINDSFGTAVSTIVTDAETMIDDFIARGAPEIFGILPLRPTSAWDSNYTGGRTFTPAQGALAGLYRRKGVQIIPMAVDFAGRGLLTDGLHPGVNGHDVYSQLTIEGICQAQWTPAATLAELEARLAALEAA